MTAAPTVAIVGAGVAGLTAAQRLAGQGLAVTVLEARSRLGGRIDTRHDFGPCAIELGAEFVHGRHRELVRLIEEAGLHLEPRRFDPLVLQDGRDVTDPQAWQAVFAVLADPDAPDVPMAERARALAASGALPERAVDTMCRYVEGYMAADFERVSARAISLEERAAEGIASPTDASIAEGYDALVRHLARSLQQRNARILTSTVVQEIRWRRGRVRIRARDGAGSAIVDADRVLVTVPLTILQLDGDAHGAIAFEPPLPDKTAAARALAMGNVVKLFLLLHGPLERIPNLSETVAAKLSTMTFLQTPDAPVPTWWKIGTKRTPVLVGWSGGAAAERLSQLDDRAVVAAGIETLARALSVPADVIAAHVRDAAAVNWLRDPWSRGAYSWVPAGAPKAAATLAAPVDATLFFAGEATDTAGYRGTVHGALETGLRAAQQILDSVAGAGDR
ncbi:MAG TPA: NAD(P)/FAD-dependent oxidoreductase [Candidatus Limnocylindrales bacterium]|nr:NAD(P)/FAD-dependent oxidoreductase [Candidatus Limnocylindrales bacterium]